MHDFRGQRAADTQPSTQFSQLRSCREPERLQAAGVEFHAYLLALTHSSIPARVEVDGKTWVSFPDNQGELKALPEEHARTCFALALGSQDVSV